MVFEHAKDAIRGIGYSAEHAVLTSSYLRAEILASTAVAQYHVPILVNDTQNGSQYSTEKRLNLQDIFVVAEIGLFLELGTADGSSNTQLYSFPDPNVFTTGASSLYNLYNGFLNVIVNNQNVVPAWDLFRHYFVPQQQTVTASKFIDQLDGSANGFYPVEPNVVLNGAANIQASLVLPAAIGTLDAHTRISVQFRGILAQNCTTVK
jgi:hypothetical protein